MNNKEIANTILAQMKAMDFNLILCMGMQNPTIIERGLRFKVNGLRHRGHVEISVNGLDLYDVKLIKTTRKQSEFFKSMGKRRFEMSDTVVAEFKDVNVVDLMPTLAMQVEGTN